MKKINNNNNNIKDYINENDVKSSKFSELDRIKKVENRLDNYYIAVKILCVVCPIITGLVWYIFVDYKNDIAKDIKNIRDNCNNNIKHIREIIEQKDKNFK
jgi:hypothetical protein